jgi:hypothetical protein
LPIYSNIAAGFKTAEVANLAEVAGTSINFDLRVVPVPAARGTLRFDFAREDREAFEVRFVVRAVMRPLVYQKCSDLMNPNAPIAISFVAIDAGPARWP